VQNNDAFSARGDGAFGVSGRLTFETAPGFLHHTPTLLAAGENVSVDLSGVTHTDSAGLALLLEWLQQARAAGRKLSFSGFPDQTRRLIDVSGLGEVFGLG
jgi:phospholipid transport system transporter-binding protein